MEYVSRLHRPSELPASFESGAEVMQLVSDLEFVCRPRSASRLRDIFVSHLRELGWAEQVRINLESRITITAIKQDVGLCFQTGNMGRFYADLLKLQYLYVNHRVSCGIYVIPTKPCAQKLGSNIANFERFTEELSLFEDIIAIPMLVIGLM